MPPARNPTLDIAKALCIMLVVFGHMAEGLNQTDTLLRNSTPFHFFIYTFHMPVFFILAGYQAYKSQQKYGSTQFLQSKTWSLIYPYFLWSAVLITMKIFTGSQVNQPATFLDLAKTPFIPFDIFWFLFVLLAMHLTFALIPRYPLCLTLLALATQAIASLWFSTERFYMDVFLYHLPSYILGLLLASRNLQLPPKTLTHPLTLSAAALILAIGSFTLYPTIPQPVSLQTLPLTLSGILFTLALSQSLSTTSLSTLLSYIGRHSMAIYVMHIIFTAGTRIILTKLGLTSSPLLLTLGTATGIIGPLVVLYLLQKLHLASWAGLTGKSPLNTKQK